MLSPARARRHVAVIAFLSIAAARAGAQTTDSTSSARLSGSTMPRALNGLWASIGVGAGGAANNGGGLLVGLSLHMQQDKSLWSLRWDGLATGWDSDVQQFSLVFGRGTSEASSRFLSGSVGLGYVASTSCRGDCGLLGFTPDTTHTTNTIGLSLAGEMAIRAGARGGVGIGLTSVASINPKASFVAVGLSLSGGRWR